MLKVGRYQPQKIQSSHLKELNNQPYIKMVKLCVNKVSVPYHSVNVEDRIMEIRQISARQNF